MKERGTSKSFNTLKRLCDAPDRLPGALRDEIQTLVRKVRQTCSSADEFEETMDGVLEVFLGLWLGFAPDVTFQELRGNLPEAVMFVHLHKKLMDKYGRWSRFYSDPNEQVC
jgi:hypothetical protein